MDVSDWLVDDALYRLPDGTIVRAIVEERDKAFRWVLRDQAGQRRFVFLDDGRVRTYVRADDPTPQDTPRGTSVSMVPCDLTLEDLQAYRAPSTEHQMRC